MTRRMIRELYTAGVSAAAPPIGPYERRAALVRPWDPRVEAVARRVIDIVHEARPELVIEHIGSTAVPGLPGKGIVDLGTEADPAEIPAITEELYSLGFGPQPGPNPWPATRPMVVGSLVHDGEEYRIHFHVHPRGTGDLAKDIRFRDALRTDPVLRDGYAAIKAGIVGPEGGPTDAVRYQAEKGEWILEVFDQLGIPRPVNAIGPIGEGAGSIPADRSST
jgi:dephospho-CoA kinase